MSSQPHFIAELVYRKTEDGGRKTAVKNGYRGQVKFEFAERTSGVQKFIGKEYVFPGEKVVAEIAVLSPHFLKGKLEVGMAFTIHEGLTLVATGKVMEIFHEDLKASS